MFAEQLRPGEIRIVSLSAAPMPDWLKKLAEAPAPKDLPSSRELVLRHRKGTMDFDGLPGAGLPGNERPARLRAADRDTVDWLTAGGKSCVCWVVNADNRDVDVQCHAFVTADFGADLPIGVDDDIAGQVRVAGRLPAAGFEPVRNWLRDEFALPTLEGWSTPRYLHSSGPNRDAAAGIRPLTLHGRRWVADIAVVDDTLRIVRLTDAPSRQRDRWVRLSPVDLRFVDRGEEAAASEAIKAALLSLSADGRRYLDLWQQYNKIERESLVDDAQRMKSARFHACHITAGGLWRFQLQPDERAGVFLHAVAAFRGKLQLEASTELPPELQEGRGRPGRGVHGEVRDANKYEWTIDLAVEGPDAPPPAGHLFRSMSGDRTRLSRRDVARERIANDQAELSGLRLLIEGEPRPGAKSREGDRFHKVVRKVVNPDGTAASLGPQGDALELALRTPDILLVQGPPGTGKTRFIADLLRCLDELGDRTVTVQRTLLSSVQHDAVDNVARKARRYGLPPSRVGARAGRDWESAREWRDEVVETLDRQLREHHPASERHDAARRLRDLASSYQGNPMTGSDLVGLLGVVRELAGPTLPAELRDELDRLLADRSVVDRVAVALADGERQRLCREARSLRVTPAAFADDGPQRADRARQHLDRLLDDRGRLVLQSAAQAGTAPPPALLSELADLRIDILGRLADDATVLHTPTHDPDVEALLHLIAEAVTDEVAATADSAVDVLLAYRDDLREDLPLVESTLARYNAVLASTVQHATSDEMTRLIDAPLPVFDTVIVDEAARANPLDLMIPMALARQRIILVGDHRQLPHVLEQKIERELRRNRTLDGSELAKSLFERWFELFEGTTPVRTIQLRTQFRMHPGLGRFVSEVFYGGPDVIASDPSTDRLTHDLPTYAGKLAAWIDVPAAAGHEERDGTSWTRPAEAARLVQELHTLAALDRDRMLTFGVITFYKAQQTVLEAELQQRGLAVTGDDGVFAPVPAMALTAEDRPRPRLRVGTVDAFQGMEFDVVLLSVTRSSQVPQPLGGPAEAVRRYGHLLSDSRMCVAMSRQRRLLIAVGNAAMAERSATPQMPGRPGRSIAEGIVAFREFCEGVHGGGVRS